MAISPLAIFFAGHDAMMRAQSRLEVDENRPMRMLAGA